MQPSVLLLIDTALPGPAIEDWKTVARDFGAFLNLEVALMLGDSAGMTMLASNLAARPAEWELQSLEQGAEAPPPMTSAEFVYREDGRPNWSAMWTSFCELALYGGPPHRGEESALTARGGGSPDDGAFDAVAEIRRGIFETTGLFAEPAEDGWVAVSCHSRKMAAWLSASIILENVEARSDGERLYLPASASFALQDEVKSVITVLAKTNHYWEAHIAAQQAVTEAGHDG